MADETYKRAQVEWALWRSFTLGRTVGDGPPPVFKTRIKRLLDIDRTFDCNAFELPPASEFSFIGQEVSGTGFDIDFVPVDVFCLALALDLLDVGFKQSEIVFVMRYLRVDLERWFPRLIERPSLIDRQNHLAKHHPKLPSYQAKGGKTSFVDARVFLVLNRIELTELLPGLASKTKSRQPVFQEPVFCEGVVELNDCLHDLMPLHRRTVILLEMAAIAQAVAAFLEVAPLRPRGRPRNKRT